MSLTTSRFESWRPVRFGAGVVLAAALATGCGSGGDAEPTSPAVSTAESTAPDDSSAPTTASAAPDTATTPATDVPVTTAAEGDVEGEGESMNDVAIGTDIEALREIIPVPGEPLGVWYGGVVPDPTVTDPQPDDIVYVAVIEYGRLSEVGEVARSCGEVLSSIEVPGWFPEAVQETAVADSAPDGPLPVLETQVCDESDFGAPTELGSYDPRFVFVRLTADDFADA